MGLAAFTPAQELDEITIIYPKPAQVVGAVDSTFVFGHIPDDLPYDAERLFVRINGRDDFPVHEDGGWLAFVPVTPGEFTFDVRLHSYEDVVSEMLMPPVLATGSVQVQIPEPAERLPSDSVAIVGDYDPPAGDLVLNGGELLRVSFRGTPNLSAWFSIPGVVDSVPMVEAPPRAQAYWGESVFGAGAIPDSLLIHGIYTGYYRVPSHVTIVDTPVVYQLGLSQDAIEIMTVLTGGPSNVDDSDSSFFGLKPLVQDTSGYRLSINHSGYPFTVRFTDSVQTIRHDPRRGYFSIFQPEGVEALAVGAEGAWYKLKLSESQYAWAAAESVEPVAYGILPAKSYLKVIRTYRHDDHVLVEFPLSGKHPYRVIEDTSKRLRVLLYGVTSDTDWIRYDRRDSLIELITWQQVEPGCYEATIDLSRALWGFDTYYDGNRLYLQLNYAPDDLPFIEGKRIVIDPGHSGDPGAVGPTGYTEAEANLGISLMLAELLEHRGAEVIMTRADARHVELYDRPSIARAADADLFISVHNNALPDGVNPFENHGTSSFYYHPHSQRLAAAIHQRMVAAADMPDHGLYHGNLAVNRPTQYPAVLVECAFMMLPEHEARLKTDRFRITIARAIAAGIDDFLKEYADDR
ncbi:hypothetical protein GF420_11115 [candidate division GN15 bacterium]|nr:hypothetical protein [candidate division GN15 bacterium]